ncbi:acetate--CoA ligase family protein [Nocardia sp. NPDC059246]|uniref:acetate--CoA ligase family protein n=1 Tax=unclassified Nocardia TaxID=2637762 RepID=UPI00369A4855
MSADPSETYTVPETSSDGHQRLPERRIESVENARVGLELSHQLPRDLTSFFAPRSLAIVGASDTPGKWGHFLATAALRGADRRSVYFVNPSGRHVLGQPTYRHLGGLPKIPELVVVAVPMAAFDRTIDLALSCGSKAIVAITAGFAEVGADGAEHQRELVRRVRAEGASLIGPNCLGVLDTHAGLDVSWIPGNPVSPGPVGVISQSGNLGCDIARRLSEVGLGVSRLVSLGNQADIGVADAVWSLALHEETRLIAVYCEDFRDGRAFLRAAQKAVSIGKPVVLIDAAGGEETARAARSHTGALTTDDSIVDAVCRASGTVRVFTPTELVDVAQIMLGCARPQGRRVGVVADGGGHAVVAADLITRAGLSVDLFSDRLRKRLAEATHDNALTANPVEPGGAGLGPTAITRCVKALVDAREVDAIVMTGGLGSYDELGDEELGQQEVQSGIEIARLVADASLPLIVQTYCPDTRPSTAMRDAGIPIFRELERAIGALSRVVQSVEHVPEPIADLTPDANPPEIDGYFGARQLIASAGVEFPHEMQVDTLADALAAAQLIGYPVALKAVSLLHKSDAGGVALNLPDEQAVRSAFDNMQSIPGPYSMQAMITKPEGVELVIGCRRDPHFGPVLLVGFGGIYAEVLRDCKVLVAPASPSAVERILRSLRGASLLDGPRGGSPVDVDAVCNVAARISEIAAKNANIREIEVNPLLAHSEGAIALDARIVCGTE